MKRNPIPVESVPGRDYYPPLNPVERESIQLFLQLARVLGQRPSVAEIYGLLFVSLRPLPQDDFINRLNLSKGSASQGITYLLELGAVRTVAVDDRRVHYEAVAELRNLASRFLRQQVLANFEDSGERLDRIAAEAKRLSPAESEFALNRVRMLRSCIPATTRPSTLWAP
jgi:DNA-binding transcriptional regulator GbsR (MarR family)